MQPFPSGFRCSRHDMDYAPSCGPKHRVSRKQWSTGTVWHRPQNVLVQTDHSIISPSYLLGYRSLSLLRSRNWHRTLNLSYKPKPQYKVSNLLFFNAQSTSTVILECMDTERQGRRGRGEKNTIFYLKKTSGEFNKVQGSILVSGNICVQPSPRLSKVSHIAYPQPSPQEKKRNETKMSTNKEITKNPAG